MCYKLKPCPFCGGQAELDSKQAFREPVEDLSALVQRLVRHLRKAAPDDELSDKAMAYLRRAGRLGSPLRDGL